METSISAANSDQNGIIAWIKHNWGLLLLVIGMLLLPFIVAFFDGQSFSDVLASETGSAKFIQGLMIEIFILAIYAISYDLITGECCM